MFRKKKVLKTFIKISAVILGTGFAVLSIIAKVKKKSSVYMDVPDQKNPLEGKKVRFIENENEPENADGVKGHLEAVGVSDYTPGFYDKYVKRVIDITLSFCGLVVLSPIFAAIALAIKIEDPGPVLFTQKRLGKNKQYFKLHKFRSMKVSTPHDVPTHMLENPEQYITKVGKFIRKHSLDELPQIWDIFIGNMSIIGPRPGLWNQDVLTAERDKYGANDVRPGLTGWAQINGRDELEIPEKAKLDGEYVKNMGLAMDIKCFLGSVHVFGKDESVVEGGTGEMKKEGGQNNSEKKILVICQYYYPEPFRHTDICEELVKNGYDVTVVTGLPNYPMGEIYEGYRNRKKRYEVINGVKVHRCFTIGRKQGAIYRFLNYYSYVFSSTLYITKLKEKYDLVFVNQLSPVMMAEAAIKYKKKNDIPFIMYCLDLWPESLVMGGVERKSVIYRFFHKISEKIYTQADKILITSRAFSDYFDKEFGIKNTEYLPQYAETIFVPEQCEKKENDYIDLMFAGNVGAAQSVETIIKAAKLTKTISNLRWHIVGDGSELEQLRTMAKGMRQVIFHGRKTLAEMPKYYAMADAMLVTMQKNSIISLTLPGKVQTYMAAGKPIIGAIDGETSFVISEAKCGICGRAEDAKALAENVESFIYMNKKQLGKNAREYYEQHFSKEMFMNRLEKIIKDMAV